jgi:hypothetical protein
MREDPMYVRSSYNKLSLFYDEALNFVISATVWRRLESNYFMQTRKRINIFAYCKVVCRL